MKPNIINRMLVIMSEAHELDKDIVDHHTFYEAYSHAAEQLNHEEDEDGENDIYKFIYEYGTRYFTLYSEELKPILIKEGLTTVEQRKEFNRKTFVLS